MTSFFVICPIGSDDSDDRKHSDRVLKHLIKPAIKNVTSQDDDECVHRADLIAKPGHITQQIIEKLRSTDIVIADLTGQNANVMYELGLRHGTEKPCVLLCQKNQELPFDLADLRTIFYEIDVDEVEKAKLELSKHISDAISSGVPHSNLQFIGSKSSKKDLQKTISNLHQEMDSLDKKLSTALHEKKLCETKLFSLQTILGSTYGLLGGAIHACMNESK